MLGNNALSTLSAQRANEHKPVRVCIRGIFGLLGSRIALAIRKNPDMRLTVGIAKRDPTLEEALRSMKPLPEEIARSACAEKMYLDDKHDIVREVNESQLVKFEPADQLSLAKECDIIIDAASPGSSEKWLERYKASKKPVILQSGEEPRWHTIIPPKIRKIGLEENIFRQGDCVLSGIVPVLTYLSPLLSRATMHILTQYTDKLNDYTTDDRMGTTYIREDVKEHVKNELAPLFPDTEIVLLGVSQVSGLSYYTATMLLDTKYPISGEELTSCLEGKPRIRVVPDIKSTFEIARYHKERMHAFGREIPPITVFGSDLTSREKTTMLRLMIAIDYRYIAVLPNIDAVRMLALGMSGEKAMRETDRNMGFVQQ